MNDLKIFAGTANQALARRITDYLGVPLGDIALGKFPDGEISCKINEDIRGRDVFLIQPTCPPVNENIMQLLVMMDSCAACECRAHHCRYSLFRLRAPGPQG